MYFKESIEEHKAAVMATERLESELVAISKIITQSMNDGGTLFLCGNGGSAADSQHIAAEFTGRFVKDRAPLRAIALTTDTSALTCITNDYSYDEVFSRQLLGLARKGDVLIGISTSGNSTNVVSAIEASKSIGVTSIGFLGRDGGELKDLCDVSCTVEHSSTARIQECHILLLHILVGLIEEELGLSIT